MGHVNDEFVSLFHVFISTSKQVFFLIPSMMPGCFNYILTRIQDKCTAIL
jgi:hypothetical protein